MRTFFDFIKLIFLLFGFDVDGKLSPSARISTILNFWKFINPILMVIGSIQLWIYISKLSKDNSTIEVAITILDVPFFVQAVVGYLTLITTGKSSIELIRKIEKIYEEITKNGQKIEDEEIVKNAHSIGNKIFGIITGVIVLNCLVNSVKIFVAYLTDTHPGELFFPISFWFPEYFHRSLLFLTIYNTFVLMLFNFSTLVVPELIFITSAYLAESFDRLGDKVKEAIDGTENRSFLETKRTFAVCVDLHNELIKLADESNMLYGYFNFILLFVVSISICLLGIMTMVNIAH